MKKDGNIPYKTYLEEHEIPKQWYNVRADMPVKPAPLLNPGTGKPLTLEEMEPIFCTELIKQELTASGVSPAQFISINFEDMSYSHL